MLLDQQPAISSGNKRTTALAIFAWVALSWTFRGQDGPFLMGTLALCGWFAWDAQSSRQRLPTSLRICIGLWLGLLALSLFRAMTGAYMLDIEAHFDWVSLLLFVPAGVLLFERREYLPWLLLTPVFAVVARIISHLSLDNWQHELFGRGFNGFGLHHVPFGMQAFLALITLLQLGPAAVRQLNKHRWIAAVMLILMALLITQALFRCGSRSGLIGFAAGLMVMLWLQRHTLLKVQKTTLGKLSLLSVIAVVCIAITLNHDVLQKRFSPSNLEGVNLSFELSDIPRDKDIFLGRRLHLSAYGINHWQQAPLLGHGPGNTAALLAIDPDFHIHKHLHNMYVQTIVELGALGAGIWSALSLSLLLSVARSTSDEVSTVTYKQLFWTLSTALAVWSLQSAPISSASWRYAVILVFSLGLAVILTNTHYAKNSQQN